MGGADVNPGPEEVVHALLICRAPAGCPENAPDRV